MGRFHGGEEGVVAHRGRSLRFTPSQVVPYAKRLPSYHQDPTFGEFPCLKRPLPSAYSSTIHHHPADPFIPSMVFLFRESMLPTARPQATYVSIHLLKDMSRSPPREFLAVRNKTATVKVRVQVSAWTSAVRLPASPRVHS